MRGDYVHFERRDARVRRQVASALRIAKQAEVIRDPGLQKEAYLVGRGETHSARVSSAMRRREFADPAKRREVLRRLISSRTPESYARVRSPRGPFIASPKKKPSKAEHGRRLSAASKARFQDPEFRARVLRQLAAAREVEFARRRALAAPKKGGAR